MARCFGLEVNVLTPGEACELWPLMNGDDLVGAVHLPKDGQTNPVDTTQALAKAARNRGARIIENVKVTEIVVEHGSATGVRTAKGDIEAEFVVNCGRHVGAWARRQGRGRGAAARGRAFLHRHRADPGAAAPPARCCATRTACTYVKEDAGKLLVGWFEPVAKPWGMDGIPESFAFDQLPEDLEHIEPLLEAAIRRVPALGKAGIQLFFNGPESFTPDDRYLLGETPEVRNLFVAAGFNSIGIQSAGGAGKVLADWIVDGHPPMDLWDVDIRRVMPFQRNRRYLKDRTVEALGPALRHALAVPAAGDGARRAPFRPARPAQGARRVLRRDRRLGAAELVRARRRRARIPIQLRPPELVRLFGRRSIARCARRSASSTNPPSPNSCSKAPTPKPCSTGSRRMTSSVPVGRIVYTQWLNERGGIEADLTVTREAEDRFLIVTSAASQTRDLAWLRRHMPERRPRRRLRCDIGYAVLGVMGPHSAKAAVAR